MVLTSLAALGLWGLCVLFGIFVLKRSARPTASLALIIAAAVLIRLLFFQMMQAGYSAGDTSNNLAMAANIVAGRGICFYDPYIKATVYALYPPVFPVFISALVWLGLDTPFGFWGFNVCFDLMSILLLVRLGRGFGAPLAGYLAAWCFAIWPPFAALSSVIQKESLENFQLLAILSLLWSLYQSPQIRWPIAAALGLATGLLALTQPAMALFPAVAIFFLFWRRGGRYLLELGLKAAPFALLVLMPWWVRNWIVFGRFVPLTTTMGYGIWVASHAGATGMWLAPPPHFASGGEIATTNRLAQAGVDWLMQHPLEWLRITGIKVTKSLAREDFFPFVVKPGAPFGSEGFQSLRQFLFQAAHTGLLAYCAVYALRLRASPLFQPMRLFCAAACISLLLSGVPFEFSERHRYILVLLLFLMAGALLAAPTRSASEMQRPPIG